MAALTGYTTDRARVYHEDDDQSRFLNEIDRVGFFPPGFYGFYGFMVDGFMVLWSIGFFHLSVPVLKI